MASITQQSKRDRRPQFMVALGLLPPYSVEDVKQAFRGKAKATHPDGGGDAAQFIQLREAYERALEFTQLHEDRRGWIGARIEKYMSRELIVDEVQRWGGRVDMESNVWLERSYGPDLSRIVDRLAGIHLCGPQVGDEALNVLAEDHPALKELRLLDLSQSRISDKALNRLRGLKSLNRLDLRDTPISNRGLQLLNHLPDLDWLQLGGTSVNWWGRARLRWSFPKLEVVFR
jgi:Leucine-rich repeat (LRR) protein